MKKFAWGVLVGFLGCVVFMYFGGADLLERVVKGARHTQVKIEHVEEKGKEVKEKAGEALKEIKP